MPYQPPAGNGWPTAAGFDRHNGGAVGRPVCAARLAAGLGDWSGCQPKLMRPGQRALLQRMLL